MNTPAAPVLVLLTALAACTSAAAAPPAPADRPASPPGAVAARRGGTIVVEVSGFRNQTGKALIGLFTSAKGFPDGAHAARRIQVAIERGGARAVFADLAPGTYAIAVLHDEDGDFAMDTSFVGIPTEGYGASNNARRRFGPPEWNKAKFALASGRKAVQKIRLIY
jgi:uncharacterized protein (DUF2141 family)